jgi:hypothetical protein
MDGVSNNCNGEFPKMRRTGISGPCRRRLSRPHHVLRAPSGRPARPVLSFAWRATEFGFQTSLRAWLSRTLRNQAQTVTPHLRKAALGARLNSGNGPARGPRDPEGLAPALLAVSTVEPPIKVKSLKQLAWCVSADG